jgi:hypothetical protein
MFSDKELRLELWESSMFRRFHSKTTPTENLQIIVRSIPWKLFILVLILGVIAVPAFICGLRLGDRIMPSMTNYFYIMGDTNAITPTPYPVFPPALPQVGSLLYTVQEGDSCDEILAYQMRMASAGHIFSDVKPETVRALNAAIGHNCDRLQPGLVLTLSPQYPLAALSGIIEKVSSTSPHQALPTPLIRVTSEPDSSIDCSGGCYLRVRIAPNVRVNLLVQTTVSVRIGSWIWTRALMARKHVANFDNYPYADPLASFNGMTMQACDVQIDNAYDKNTPCDELNPTTIDEDGGAWFLGVASPTSLGHWKYPLKVATGTPVMLWLTNNQGVLTYQRGNPIYRYNEYTHLYVPV